MVDEGDSAGRRVRRRHDRHREVRPARVRGAGARALDKTSRARNVSCRRTAIAAQQQMMIRVPHAGRRAGGQADRERRSRSCGPAGRPAMPKIVDVSTEIVGPTVGAELPAQGHLGDGPVAARHPRVWIAFRFQFSFGVGAVVATIHDLLVTLAFLVFFNYDMSLNVIAAILTMTGYSMNDTIVIFDRVRENLRSMRRDPLDHVINISVNQTLGADGHHVGHRAAHGRARAVLLRRRGAATASRSRWWSASLPAPTRACSSPRRWSSCLARHGADARRSAHAPAGAAPPRSAAADAQAKPQRKARAS